jgi:hypothetical protein
MDPTTASYYRAILFTNGLDTKPLPASLLELHRWAVKRHHALGLGGNISKAVALTIAMTWLSSTEEGREYSQENTPLGDMFSAAPVDEIVTISDEDWEKLPVESEVLVTLRDNKTTRTGQFLERRGGWVDVRVDGEVKHFRISKVQLIGA